MQSFTEDILRMHDRPRPRVIVESQRNSFQLILGEQVRQSPLNVVYREPKCLAIFDEQFHGSHLGTRRVDFRAPSGHIHCYNAMFNTVAIVSLLLFLLPVPHVHIINQLSVAATLTNVFLLPPTSSIVFVAIDIGFDAYPPQPPPIHGSSRTQTSQAWTLP